MGGWRVHDTALCADATGVDTQSAKGTSGVVPSPWAGGASDVPAGGPGSERGSRDIPTAQPSARCPLDGALLHCCQLERGPHLLLFPGAAPQVTLPGHPPVDAGRARLDGRTPLPTLWGPVQEEAQSTSPQEGQRPWRSQPLRPPRLADTVCEGSLAPHSLLTSAPGCSLGASRGKPAWWGVCLAQPWDVQACAAWSHARPASGLTVGPMDGPQVAV